MRRLFGELGVSELGVHEWRVRRRPMCVDAETVWYRMWTARVLHRGIRTATRPLRCDGRVRRFRQQVVRAIQLRARGVFDLLQRWLPGRFVLRRRRMHAEK